MIISDTEKRPVSLPGTSLRLAVAGVSLFSTLIFCSFAGINHRSSETAGKFMWWLSEKINDDATLTHSPGSRTRIPELEPVIIRLASTNGDAYSFMAGNAYINETGTGRVAASQPVQEMNFNTNQATEPAGNLAALAAGKSADQLLDMVKREPQFSQLAKSARASGLTRADIPVLINTYF